MEIMDIYDSQGRVTGKTIERGSKDLKDGEFFKLATLWIKSGDKFLIQESSEEKGGEFAVSGGHVPSGKTSLQQIIIEAEEELGIKIKAEQLQLLGSAFVKHAIFDVYFIEDDSFINKTFKLQAEEVKALHFLTEEQIRDLIDKGKFRKSSIMQFNRFIAKDR